MDLSHVNESGFLAQKVIYPLQTFKLYWEKTSLCLEFEHQNSTGSFKDVSFEACKALFEDAKGKPLYLCLSGGVDSEFMARVFHASGVPFKAISMRMKGRLNEYDVIWAEHLCQELGVEHEYIEIDIHQFFSEKKHLQAACDYGCRSPQIATHLWLQREVPGYFVFAGEVPMVRHSQGKREVGSLAHPDIVAMEAQKSRLNLKGCTSFFLSSRKLLSFFLSQPFISTVNLLSSGDKVLASYDHEFYFEEHIKWLLKRVLINKLGFELLGQPTKYSGFEGLHAEEVGLFFNGAGGWDDWNLLFKGLLAFNSKYRKPQELVAQKKAQPAELRCVHTY